MPFCRKCGFEVSTWMSFCPRCGASLAPSTIQRRWYGYRVTSFLIPNTLLWVLLAILQMGTMNIMYSHVTFQSQIPWIALGIVVGLPVGIVVTRKQVSTLTEKGEMGISLSTMLLIVGGVLVFGALFLAAMFISPSLSRVLYMAIMDPILSGGISLVVTRVFLLVRWERTHKMRLYQKSWSLRIHAVPKTDSS